MKTSGCFLLLAALLPLSCISPDVGNEGLFHPDNFIHHFITDDLTGPHTWGFGASALVDLDRDGDLDYVLSARDDSVYWFENTGQGDWARHAVGPLAIGQLGGAATDIDADGWADIVIGGYWYRNPRQPRKSPFDRYEYDASIGNEIHDVVIADVDGDGRDDVVVCGDRDGAFWYAVPDNPQDNTDWARTTITMDVLDDNDDIHGGIFPNGVADLDGDGDADVVLPTRWYENRSAGVEWVAHALPFGSSGPWGLSSRSWIVDLDDDGDSDIVMFDNDQNETSGAWLENDGSSTPAFTSHPLPFAARGTSRGSFHSLQVADFDGDGDLDIFAAEQEDTQILPEGAGPRWYIWERLESEEPAFAERVIFDGRLGAHDARVGDIDGDGDLDIASKIWDQWEENANGGRFHADWLESLIADKERENLTPITDVDGNSYPVVQIGSQKWLATNLTVQHTPDGTPLEHFFVNDDPATLDAYGRLYTWDVAMNGSAEERAQGICPDGWHIPTDAEWYEMFDFLGGPLTAGFNLLSTGASGFNALLGGGADFRGNHVNFNEYALFWSSTAVSEERAYHHSVDTLGVGDRFAAKKGARIAVRCLKNR